jgi:hypothetical protein
MIAVFVLGIEIKAVFVLGLEIIAVFVLGLEIIAVFVLGLEIIAVFVQSLPRVVGPYTLCNLCQYLKSTFVLNWFHFYKILPV